MVRHRERRAITLDEHTRIVAAESNPERRSFYELAWNIGASQSHIAFLEAHDIDWQQRVISYQRKKTGEYALIRFDEEVERILRRLPASGPLFPYLRTVRPGDRATEFMQRTRALDIKESRSIPTATRGRNAPAVAATRSASPRKPSGTTARRSIAPTPAKPGWWFLPFPPTNHNSPPT